MNAFVGALTLAAIITLGIGGGDSSTDATQVTDLITVIREHQAHVSMHPLFGMLADRTIPARKRMSFAPYLVYFVITFADVLETWVQIPQPKTELEEQINVYVKEETFHYNYFFHDMKVLGYTVDRFGSFEGVIRHVWGDESRPMREFMYTLIHLVKKYNDPVVTLAMFEAVEATGEILFKKINEEVVMPEGGLQGLRYFGELHLELERNHTQTNWYKEKEVAASLQDMQITHEQRENSLLAIDEIFQRYAPARLPSI